MDCNSSVQLLPAKSKERCWRYRNIYVVFTAKVESTKPKNEAQRYANRCQLEHTRWRLLWSKVDISIPYSSKSCQVSNKFNRIATSFTTNTEDTAIMTSIQQSAKWWNATTNYNGKLGIFTQSITLELTESSRSLKRQQG